MKNFQVKCIQEKQIIGKLIKEENNEPLIVDALEFIRSWRPVNDAYKFVIRPKEGNILSCPRCNGRLAIDGTCSLNGEELGAQPDGLLVGQFTIE